MTFTIEKIMQSISSALTAKYTDYPVYTSQMQQGISVPCFFISLMPSGIDTEINNRWMRDMGIDIVFIQERNIVNRSEEIFEVQDFLDDALDLIPYSDGEGTALLHPSDRSADIEDGELHYKFHLRVRVSKERTQQMMQKIEESEINGNG